LGSPCSKSKQAKYNTGTTPEENGFFDAGKGFKVFEDLRFSKDGKGWHIEDVARLAHRRSAPESKKKRARIEEEARANRRRSASATKKKRFRNEEKAVGVAFEPRPRLT
jgi:hypothetical protein